MSADLVDRGIVMAAERFVYAASIGCGRETGLPVHIVRRPVSAVPKGPAGFCRTPILRRVSNNSN